MLQNWFRCSAIALYAAIESGISEESEYGEMIIDRGGEGDDDRAGDKGKVKGDPYASGYYGNGGAGGGGNFLGNRTALNKIDPDKVCDEGTVVVEITVDRNGKVIFAKPGAKGTTNSVACLYDEAKKAAMSTKFNPDSNAPEKQFGYIIYNFSYSE